MIFYTNANDPKLQSTIREIQLELCLMSGNNLMTEEEAVNAVNDPINPPVTSIDMTPKI